MSFLMSVTLLTNCGSSLKISPLNAGGKIGGKRTKKTLPKKKVWKLWNLYLLNLDFSQRHFHES